MKTGGWSMVLLGCGLAAGGEAILESARELPVVYEADVAVAGGSSAAVAAAQAAAQKGAKVFLAAPRPYLGDDLAGCLRLWLEADETPATPLAKTLFSANPVRPLHVKSTLDAALLESNVRFLTGCYAVEVLKDEQGRVAGMVLADRQGRQAVRAKVVIDATERATLARTAGAEFTPYPPGEHTFVRMVIGGEPAAKAGLKARKLPGQFESRDAKKKGPPAVHAAWECTLQLPMKDGGWGSFAEAEQAARDRTFDPKQVDASDSLFQVPPDQLKSEGGWSGEWPGAEKLPLSAFRPAGAGRLWVLGGCADLSRAAAAKLLRPLNFLEAGARVGAAAAEEARGSAAPRGARLAGAGATPAAEGEVREFLNGLRPSDTGLPVVPAEARALPVLGRYDVVVAGGGTGGAPAGIGAARQGAKTLVIEYLHGLGGVGTLGLIGKYYHGNRVGFTSEHDAAVKELGAAVHVVGKAECWRRENRKAGAELWFGCLACGALVEKGRVKGVIVATPHGRGVVLAQAAVDSTGNADLAAAAGAECAGSGAEEIAVQGTGLPPRNLGASYTNTDYYFADDCDVLDLWHFNLHARRKYQGSYDLAQLVDTRERRRIIGEVVLSPLDILCHRTFPDTIVISKSNFDSHGYTVHELFFLRPPDHAGLTAHVPYRALLPKGLDGILVTGLAISAHRDAMPVLRMQPDVQNQGYAAGTAAAQAAKSGAGARAVDLKALQKHLVQKQCLPESVLQDRDSFPLPAERIAAAVQSAGQGYKDVEALLTQPQAALPLLRKAWAGASGEPKLVYAHLLGMLGDAAGAETLAGAVRAADWDKGWDFRGMGQYGASVSRLDSFIIALGRTRDPRALPALLEKVKTLDAGKEFSHHRALALALETLRDPAAAPALANLLAKPGMTGYAAPAGEAAKGKEEQRNSALRELSLARALFRCGDHGGAGEKILKQYEQDVRGHFARHAQAVLLEARKPGGK